MPFRTTIASRYRNRPVGAEGVVPDDLDGVWVFPIGVVSNRLHEVGQDGGELAGTAADLKLDNREDVSDFCHIQSFFIR